MLTLAQPLLTSSTRRAAPLPPHCVVPPFHPPPPLLHYVARPHIVPFSASSTGHKCGCVVTARLVTSIRRGGAQSPLASSPLTSSPRSGEVRSPGCVEELDPEATISERWDPRDAGVRCNGLAGCGCGAADHRDKGVRCSGLWILFFFSARRWQKKMC
jgi:hypothetical protein